MYILHTYNIQKNYNIPSMYFSAFLVVSSAF